LIVDHRERQQTRYVTASIEKTLGALPVVADYSRRLDLAGIIDRACPIRDLAHLTHGQVIETLIANRLTSPTPLVRVTDWARDWAVEEVFGIDPALLNDDRIGRTLDAIAPELDRIVGSVGAQAITAFGIDTSRLHWDMTSISLYGAYDHTDEQYPAPKFGHPKDRRVDLHQIQAGLAVTGDGGIPVFHRAYDGGAGEVAQVGAMIALTTMAAPREFLLIGDSKLVSYNNITLTQVQVAEALDEPQSFAMADVLGTLRAALRAAERVQQAYLVGSPHIRRQINQGFFKKLFIGEQGIIERVELNEPFAALMSTAQQAAAIGRESTVPAIQRTPWRRQPSTGWRCCQINECGRQRCW
jgi:hypothetical protein